MSLCKFFVFEKLTHTRLYQILLKIMLLSILIGNSVTDYLSVVHYSDFKIIKIYIIFFISAIIYMNIVSFSLAFVCQ